MLQFTPLSGPYVDGPEGTVSSTECSKALAYLVEIDQVRILLDCGAPEDFTFPASLIKTDDADRGLHGSLPDILQRIGPSIDVVLLFHAELSHMGLYAYAYAHYGLQCPVYATLPVQTMGRLQMLEVVRSWQAEADVGTSAPVQRFLPTEAQVDEAFDAIRSLRYMQPTPLDGKCAGLVLTAYNAGHSLGGTVWKLRSPSVGTVVMALDWNPP